jgi:hypothetical protein
VKSASAVAIVCCLFAAHVIIAKALAITISYHWW